MEKKNFKPEDFGFDMSFSKRASGNHKRGCYVTTDANGKNLKLVIDAETYDRALDMFGDRVCFGMDGKGRILLTDAIGSFGRKMSKSTKYGVKATLSIGTMTDDYVRLMGTFKRLYLEAQVYHGGDGIVLTPTGEIDRV